MRLLWVYEHELAAISASLLWKEGQPSTATRPSTSLARAENRRLALWRTDGYNKSFSTGPVPTDLLLHDRPVRLPSDFAGPPHGAASI